jgi:hypothetical protein
LILSDEPILFTSISENWIAKRRIVGDGPPSPQMPTIKYEALTTKRDLKKFTTERKKIEKRGKQNVYT